MKIKITISEIKSLVPIETALLKALNAENNTSKIPELQIHKKYNQITSYTILEEKNIFIRNYRHELYLLNNKIELRDSEN